MEVKVMGTPVKEPEKKEFDRWEIDDAVRTLVRAEEIKADPKLMAACSKALAKQKKAIDSVDQLRKKAAELDEEEDEE